MKLDTGKKKMGGEGEGERKAFNSITVGGNVSPFGVWMNANAPERVKVSSSRKERLNLSKGVLFSVPKVANAKVINYRI